MQVDWGDCSATTCNLLLTSRSGHIKATSRSDNIRWEEMVECESKTFPRQENVYSSSHAPPAIIQCAASAYCCTLFPANNTKRVRVALHKKTRRQQHRQFTLRDKQLTKDKEAEWMWHRSYFFVCNKLHNDYKTTSNKG